MKKIKGARFLWPTVYNGLLKSTAKGWS